MRSSAGHGPAQALSRLSHISNTIVSISALHDWSKQSMASKQFECGWIRSTGLNRNTSLFQLTKPYQSWIFSFIQILWFYGVLQWCFQGCSKPVAPAIPKIAMTCDKAGLTTVSTSIIYLWRPSDKSWQKREQPHQFLMKWREAAATCSNTCERLCRPHPSTCWETLSFVAFCLTFLQIEAKHNINPSRNKTET